MRAVVEHNDVDKCWVLKASAVGHAYIYGFMINVGEILSLATLYAGLKKSFNYHSFLGG